MADALKDTKDVEPESIIDENDSDESLEPEKVSILLGNIDDQVTKKDTLGFEPYVTAITKFLTDSNTKPPLTLSIEGEWGSGKSSFMAQLEKQLKEKNEFTVSFNAWRHDNEDSLWAAFALNFIGELSSQLSLLRRFKGDIKLLFSRFRWKKQDPSLPIRKKLEALLSLASWKNLEVLRFLVIWIFFVLFTIISVVLLILKGADWVNSFSGMFVDGGSQTIVNWFIGLVGGVASLGVLVSFMLKLKNTIGSPFGVDFSKYFNAPDYEGRVDFIENFHKDFKNIVKAYAGGNKVYVFIDDLDRCEVPKAADLMQAINLMISCDPHLIFIVGMDRKKVAGSIAAKHEKLLPYLSSSDSESIGSSRQGLTYGYAFIEKFIQVSFLVPKPTKDDFKKLLEDVSKNVGKGDVESDQPKKLTITEFIFSIFGMDKYPVISDDEKGTVVNDAPSVEKIDEKLEGIEGKYDKSDKKVGGMHETIELEHNGHSKSVNDIILMAAPALDNNPRRIKQFINLFRLKLYIARDTGLFVVHKNSPAGERLTLEQLGKFVAISLKWPLLLNDLDANRSLLAQLEEAALDPESKMNSYWCEEEKLMELLRFGLVKNGTSDETNKSKCSLSGLNVDKLLQVSPRVTLPDKNADKSLHESPDVAPSEGVGDIENAFDPIPYSTTPFKDIGMEFTLIKAGDFMMGSDEYDREKPVHNVKISKSFYLGTYPVTQREWNAIMVENHSGSKGDDLPVENVSWNDVKEFIRRLNDHEGIDKYRLPSEAEWEYACRAGTTTRYSFGDDESKLGDYAWYADNSDGKTHPVNQKKPNDWGLHDIHGNVWEWVQDKWHNDYIGAREDGNAWEERTDSFRVRRGGSWDRSARRCRSADRGSTDPSICGSDIGFRLLREL